MERNENLTPSFRLFLGIFFLSASVIIFEIVVTRISSIIFTYNYAFLVVSLAILGLGCGGIFAYYRYNPKRSYTQFEILSKLSFYSCLFSIFITLFIIFVTKVFFFLNLFLYFATSFIPFFFAGVALSLTFQLFSSYSFKLYFSDLTGAAVGAVSSIIILEKFGGVNSVIFIGILGIISAFCFIINYNKKAMTLSPIRFSSILAIVILIFFILNIFLGFLGEVPIQKSDIKDLYLMLNSSDVKAEIIESRWSAFGRVDLVEVKGNDKVRYLFIDGAAGSPMFKFDGNIKKANENLDFLKMIFSGTFPFYFLNESQKDSMLIIGPGGGREVIIGLVNGVKNITGVEINRDFVNIVNDYKNYNGGVYTNFNNVNIITSEGRSFVRGVNTKFDIIMIIQPFTKSSRSLEGYALTENYLLTVEAVKDYLNHLTKEGSLIIVLHNTNEIMRLITSALAAFEDTGIKNSDAMHYFYTVGRGATNPVLVLRNTPFASEESEKILNKMLELELISPLTYISGLDQRFINLKNQDGSIVESKLFNDDLLLLEKGKMKLDDLIIKSSFNIKPTTDNRPFFFKDEKGVPANIIPILIIAIIINAGMVVLSIIKSKQNKGILKLMLLSILLGFGFMMIEISFYQRLILYIGSPIIALAIILGMLLAGMGLGSLFGERIFPNQNRKKIIIFSFIICILVTGLFFILSTIFSNSLSYSIYLKALVCAGILLPIGFILGIPFPAGINLARKSGFTSYVTWMYGINGTMSVLGSVSTIALSTVLGFSTSLIVGSVCYLAIAFIFLFKK